MALNCYNDCGSAFSTVDIKPPTEFEIISVLSKPWLLVLVTSTFCSNIHVGFLVYKNRTATLRQAAFFKQEVQMVQRSKSFPVFLQMHSWVACKKPQMLAQTENRVWDKPPVPLQASSEAPCQLWRMKSETSAKGAEWHQFALSVWGGKCLQYFSARQLFLTRGYKVYRCQECVVMEILMVRFTWKGWCPEELLHLSHQKSE